MRISDLSEQQFLRYYETRLAEKRFRRSGPQYSALCPFHDDWETASFRVNTEKGTWFCHGLCKKGGGVIEFEKLFSGVDDQTAIANIGEIVGEKQLNLGSKPEAVYSYVDANGIEIFQVVRNPGKRFIQRKKNASGAWEYKTSDLKMVLYHLNEVVSSNETLVTEGEKDADNLRTAVKDYYGRIGQPPARVAVTTSPRGAGKWQDFFAPYFCGKRVTIFQDNDEPGRKHAKQVAESVYPYANGVKIVSLPGVKDVSDFLAAGHTIEEIIQIVKQAPTWKPEESASSLFMAMTEFHEKAPDHIEWLVEGVIQSGANGLLISRPKAGKSFTVLDLALALASGQKWLGFYVPKQVRVALVSREDNGGLTQWRAAKLERHRGLSPQELDTWLYINAKGLKPRIMLDYPEDVAELIANLKRQQSEFLILDVMRVLHGSDENDATDMQKVLDVLNRIQDEVGCSVCLIHHDNKRPDATLTERVRGSSAIAGYAEFVVGVRVMEEKEWTREFSCELKAAMAPDKFYFRILDTADAGIKLEQVDWEPLQSGQRKAQRKANTMQAGEEESPF
jgi:putative DNA primase/helicase